MSLFVDREIPVESNSIVVELAWHSKVPLLAIGAYSEEKGGNVRLVDGSGSATEEVDPIPAHATAQVSCLMWHPIQTLLCVGWENGDVYVYDRAQTRCIRVDTLHNASVAVMRWSAMGSRLITCDKSGSVIGWRLDSSNQMSVVFHHELKDELRGLVFCSTNIPFANAAPIDISGLARAAVAGDEQALDLFTSGLVGRSLGSSENLNCYSGSVSGVVYYLNENGSCMEVLQAEGAVKYLLHYQQYDRIIVITESMVIGQFQVESDGSLNEISKIKVSTRSKENHTSWVGPGMLAIASGEMSVRIWDLKSDDNFILAVPAAAPTATANEVISSLDFCEEKNILAASTNAGYVLMWKYPNNLVRPGENDWQVIPKVYVGPPIRKISWGGGNRFLAINSVRQAFILNEQELSVGYCGGVSAVQVAPSTLIVKFHEFDGSSTISTQIQIEKIRLTSSFLFLIGSGKVLTHEVQKEITHVMKVGEFSTDESLVTSDDNSVYTLQNDRINVRSFQGTIKHSLYLSETDGNGTYIDVAGSFLIVTTDKGIVKIWDVSKRDARLHTHPISLKEKISDFGQVLCVKINSNASHLSVVVKQPGGSVDPKLYIYDIERDILRYFNFASGHNDTDDNAVPPNSATSRPGSPSHHRDDKTVSLLHAKAVSDRVVVDHLWDSAEPHFLVCFTKSTNAAMMDDPVTKILTPGTPDNLRTRETSIVSLFVHEDLGVVVHDARIADSDTLRLVGVEIPFIVFLKNEQSDEGPSVTANRSVMSDFVGLEDSDKTTRDAVVKFSFYLSIGNTEEAFKSIKMIKNQNVWGNLARMCVKSQRLDVASICLGKMGHASGARAMRQISSQHVDKDVKTAVLAVYLGMPEEAERLLQRCKRFDLLNKLYQDSGQWEKALEIAENGDRIHLRSTFYNFAKHLEAKGDVPGAIQNYERSGTHRFEVPRLLFEDWNVLESYVQKSTDKELKRWWAQYMESTGEMELALQYYEIAGDYLSLVRVHCYCDNLDKAAEIANKSGDRAACYHLARQYENIDNINEAIHFFSKAQAYSNAIRICKEHGFSEQLWNLAVLAAPNEKLEAAKFFETCEKPQFDKAVILYEKAGYIGKAVDLAFETNQHNVLQYISSNFNEDTEPLLLDKTASFFLQNEQYEKAVDLYVASRQAIKALELCLKYNIKITEDMGEKLSGSNLEGDEKIKTLNKIAEVAYQQGNYHLATKKWTQAGNRLQAMKSLLKSGDTDKVIFFANVSRQREIYILAGNYLQTLDWRNNADIMKNIITFYTKSKSYDLLAMFYQACADVEIDEYQNYEKAHGALTECFKFYEKADKTDVINSRLIQVSRQIELVACFVECQRSYTSNPAKSLQACKALLQEANINAAVRKGDIYGFMVEHLVRVQNYREAYGLLQELRSNIPNVNLAYYINTDALLAIEKSLGVSLQSENVLQEDEVEDD